MKYQFPLIERIEDVLPAIAGRDEFVVAEKEGYTVINYNVMMADTFPPIKVAGGSAKMREERSLHNALRRECRGIIFDQPTGKIVRRPFHKFFNMNERDETQAHAVSLADKHVILEKLDGSMIAPFIANGNMIWGTKMGATDVAKPVEEFVLNNPEYKKFALWAIGSGMTPIFEWCSRKQKIVLDYADDRLVLTGMRRMTTGNYFSHAGMKSILEGKPIPVVEAFDFSDHSDVNTFIAYTRDLEDREGFIVRYDDGHMIKLKSDWYVQIHKAKEAILQDRNIVELVLNSTLDDIKAHLEKDECDRLDEFESAIVDKIMERVKAIAACINDLRGRGMDRKAFALSPMAAEMCRFSKPIVFRNMDNLVDRVAILADVVKVVRSHLGKNVKWEELREAWFTGIRYNP